MAVSSTRIPFDTVATYNDKRNNNTVNIALHRISPPKQTQTPSAAAAVMASNLRPMSSSVSMASNFSCSSTVSSVNMQINNTGYIMCRNHMVLLDVNLLRELPMFLH